MLHSLNKLPVSLKSDHIIFSLQNNEENGCKNYEFYEDR